MTDIIDTKQLAGPPKKIGMQGKRPVFAYKTKGGLYIVASPKVNKSNGVEILGLGSHPQVARINAERTIEKNKEEEIVYTELSKSEHVQLDNYLSLIGQSEELTQRARALNGDD